MRAKQFDMQHDYFLKKKVLTFDLPHGSRVCVRTEYCLHVAAFAIPLNLICNMTIV